MQAASSTILFFSQAVVELQLSLFLQAASSTILFFSQAVVDLQLSLFLQAASSKNSVILRDLAAIAARCLESRSLRFWKPDFVVSQQKELERKIQK